jgi:hypothetical protein
MGWSKKGLGMFRPGTLCVVSELPAGISCRRRRRHEQRAALGIVNAHQEHAVEALRRVQMARRSEAGMDWQDAFRAYDEALEAAHAASHAAVDLLNAMDDSSSV